MAARRRDSRAKDGVPARPRRIERNEDRFENCRALPAPTPGQRAFLFKSRRARGVRHRTPQPAARVRVDGDRHDAHAHAMASPGRLTEVKADPLLTWLERLLGERAPIGIESCLDGRLFARALRELAGEGAHPASTGDALEDLRAGLDRAGLGERCAYMLAALDARDVSGARSLLSVIYAHYAAHHARRYADDAAGPRREPEPSASSPTRSERQDERQGERRAAAARALMQGPPLDEGVYVSEPHFLPPRMDVDDNRDHPNAPPAAASVSGFVPSAAETKTGVGGAPSSPSPRVPSPRRATRSFARATTTRRRSSPRRSGRVLATTAMTYSARASRVSRRRWTPGCCRANAMPS